MKNQNNLEKKEMVKNQLQVENKDQSVETLIALAVEKKADVSTMEKLLAMRKELKQEWAREKFFEALSGFQEECPAIKKTKVVKNNDGTIRYRYSPLEDVVSQVKNLLKKYGFSYIVNSKINNNFVQATCKVIHTAGHSEESSFEVPIDQKSFMNEPQKFASALTYAKRYAFLNAFGIMTADEDDDANFIPVEKENASFQGKDSVWKAKASFVQKLVEAKKITLEKALEEHSEEELDNIIKSYRQTIKK